MAKSILLIGGDRSGKSRYAQELAQKWGGAVLFVATAEAGDEEMKRRIAAHRKSRPAAWRTLETRNNVGRQVSKHIGEARTVIVDCVTLLVNNILLDHSDPSGERINEAAAEEAVSAEISDLTDCIKRADARFIIVTSEVGMGLVPTNKMGRIYRDLLGQANQMLAQSADEVYLMVAGLPVPVKPGRIP